MTQPIVAIVGRPNVGKSAFFNYLAGRRISIVEDTPGVTRDRIYAKCDWRNREFMLIDTGGIETSISDEIYKHMQRQAEVAIDTADVIIFMTDVKSGLTAGDREVAALLHKSGKPVVIAVNKVDTPGDPPAEIYEFYNLGLAEIFPVSALHGLGIGELLDYVFEHLPDENAVIEEHDSIHVAIIGKPNSGKSSLLNRIVGEERAIVSPIAGTTRDALDSLVIKEEKKYTFIDTAGIRKSSKIFSDIEKYSIIRAWSAVERADVCILMIDSIEGITEQDSKIAGYAHEQGKAVIVALNKWDLVEKDNKTFPTYVNSIRSELPFMQYAPVIAISSLTGKRVENLFPLIDRVYENTNRRIPTGVLNDVLNEAVAMVQPPSDKGRLLRIYYMTQASSQPPTFVMFVNDKELMHFSYERYITNTLRETFDFEGTPIRFIVRERGKEN
ncbi:MAG TPA: ribosome biogenesis GTPase Der [Clostridia bacterium]|nr:MAG: GTPase Der [Firmicutes bacterium ADurb.Bin146]HOD93255.1 ribosome biogenesis GTPase Der [Clostridia bacterium]HQM39499.1 ribosome biogenesis GTPase Der [Clostridia bacterium]